MKAIVLSAGMGERLLPLTKEMPKALLEMTPGRTLLDLQCESIQRAGIKDIVFVVGYRAEMIEMHLNRLKKVKCKTIYNPFYYCSNNLISLWFARHQMNGPFILMNGDDIFRPVVLKRLLRCGGDITMVLNEKSHYEDEDMKAVVRGAAVVDVGKDIPSPPANSEAIGITLFSSAGATHLRSRLEHAVRRRESHSKFYLHLYRDMMHEGVEFNHCYCQANEWAEVDFHSDLQRARRGIRAQLSRLSFA